MDSGSVSLLVAALDLSVVRSIRDAIRTTALAAGGRPGPLGTIQNPVTLAPRKVIEPTPHIEPRKVIDPTPRIEPRRVIHPAARYEVLPPIVIQPVIEEHPSHPVQPLPPPWKMPIWEMPLPPRPVIKVHMHRPDIQNKGSLIDVFC